MQDQACIWCHTVLPATCMLFLEREMFECYYYAMFFSIDASFTGCSLFNTSKGWKAEYTRYPADKAEPFHMTYGDRNHAATETARLAKMMY
jgi:hypothetical protein